MPRGTNIPRAAKGLRARKPHSAGELFATRDRTATRRRLLVQTMRCFASLSHTMNIVHSDGREPSRRYAPFREAHVASASRPPNGFLASLSEDDFELVRPHLKTVDLTQDLVLVEV